VAKTAAIGLIVGLGNPGAKYAKTRHNVGFWFVDELAEKYSASFKLESRFVAQVARINIGGKQVWLMKPQTYMNASGPSVAGYASYYKLSATQTLAVHDELALGCGELRFKRGGGHGGHNGLRDIVSHYGPDFGRVRIGIGHPGTGQDVAGYVLNTPPLGERQLIEQSLSQLLGQIDRLVNGDFDVLSKQPNGQST
jgi:PTH1 family peptidyl-tRNA hydrolase